jgi:ATP-dependent DNA helicase HFM1/MER3
MSGKDLIESNLHRHLAEHLNSEVVLRTVTDIGYAMEWIRSTYLYVRALQNPSHYGILCSLNKKGIEGKLQEMCQRELNALASAQLLTIDHRMDVHPTKDGALMARFYLNLGTMKTFHKVWLSGLEKHQSVWCFVCTCKFSLCQFVISHNVLKFETFKILADSLLFL